MKAFNTIYEERRKRQQSILQGDIFKEVNLRTLSKDNRVYIKVLYILYNVPEGTLSNILHPIYGDHGFEKVTRKLINEGWIYKENFGGENILAVTRKTLQYIYPKSKNLEKIPIKETNIALYKCKGLAIEYYMIETYRRFLINIFNNLTKEGKKSYIQNQYIINIQYKDFISLTKAEKETYILNWAISQEEQETLLLEKRQNINQKAINIFAEHYPFIEDKTYLHFVKLYIDRLKSSEAIILLRDLKTKALKPFDLIEVIQSMKTNIVEVGFRDKMFELFSVNFLNIESYRAEYLHTKITAIRQIIEGSQRKNLQQLKYEVENNQLDKDTREIKEILKKKIYYEERIKWLKEQQDNIYKSKLIIGDDLQGKKRQLSFNRLKQNGIYIKDFGIDHKGAYMSWTIVDNLSDGLKGSLIAKRTFLINSFMNLLFNLDTNVRYNVELITYSEQRKMVLEKEVIKAIKRLQGFQGEFIQLEIPIDKVLGKRLAKYELWQKIIEEL